MKTTILSVITLLVSSITLYAQQLISEKVYSPKMNKEIETVIITPTLEQGKTYKSVYILHGYSGNPTRTYQQDIPNLKQKAVENNTIYILANGNYNSWYVDSPIKADSQYQTFIGEELVSYIDAHYPTIKDKNSRGILGWSMGGYGAIHIGTHYPKTFSIIGSSCGALDFNQFGTAYNEYQVDQVLGDFSKLNKQYLTYNTIDIFKTSKQMLILDCGTEDDQMIEMNRKFHNLLTERRIPHLYLESLGDHTPAYWSKSLSHQLSLFENYFTYDRL